MKQLFIFTAICCFIAILPLPLLYYTFLRIVIFTVAGIVVYYFARQKEYHWVAVFGIICILFNPVFPIHFNLKSIWIPIDIIAGLLFLFLVFIRQKQKEIPEETEPEVFTQTKTLSRDRIIKPTSSKNNNNNHE